MNKVTHRESNNVNLAIVHYVFNVPVVRERLDHAAAIFDVKPEVASAVKIKLDEDDLEMVYLSVISVLTIIIIIYYIIRLLRASLFFHFISSFFIQSIITTSGILVIFIS